MTEPTAENVAVVYCQIIIDKEYRAIWEVDKLLGISEYVQSDYKNPINDRHYYLRGYYIGRIIPEINKYILHNFLNITIIIHPIENDLFQIIGFNVTPGKYYL